MFGPDGMPCVVLSGGRRPLIAGCLSLQRFGMDSQEPAQSGIRSPDLLHLRAYPYANEAIGATNTNACFKHVPRLISPFGVWLARPSSASNVRRHALSRGCRLSMLFVYRVHLYLGCYKFLCLLCLVCSFVDTR